MEAKFSWTPELQVATKFVKSTVNLVVNMYQIGCQDSEHIVEADIELLLGLLVICFYKRVTAQLDNLDVFILIEIVCF